METIPLIDANEFILLVQPFLLRNDADGLVALLKSRWTRPQLNNLLESTVVDARKVAAMCLGLVGGECALKSLTKLLADPDPVVHQMAEHSMWSIWFRLGDGTANDHLARGAQSLEKKDFVCALRHFDRAIEISPNFAEPYNQRAILHYLRDQFHESIDDCRRAIDRMPCHFGAWAGMGHCHANLGDAQHAIECYRHALTINPGLEDIRATVDELQCHL
ncbi:MAG: tetratricopeptide repeat protein [Phycisphaerae bacterium]|nr:tetratricopeptide repeat protein [Phycisphaerae bacterium]